MQLLHLDSSPRHGDSISRRLSGYLAQQLAVETTVYRDLAAGFPAQAGEDLVALHGSLPAGSPGLETHREVSETLIRELMNADTLVVGVAMHNFSVPALLKRWIDYVARPGVTFRYTESGPEGLTDIDTAYLVVASGGTPIGGAMDFASGYLTHICSFLGVRKVHLIDAGGSKRATDEVIANGRRQIDELIRRRRAA